jgi:hypothetical protein
MPYPRTRRLLRRPSPPMIVALLALVIAMTGSAAAAVLVTSPDQLGSAVVTSPKLAIDSVGGKALNEPAVNTDQVHDDAVTNPKLANPVYSASINADGRIMHSVGANPALTRRLGGSSSVYYEVGFQENIKGCSTVASASAGMVTASAFSDKPNVVTVVMTRPEANGALAISPKFVPGDFSLIVQC